MNFVDGDALMACGCSPSEDEDAIGEQLCLLCPSSLIASCGRRHHQLDGG